MGTVVVKTLVNPTNDDALEVQNEQWAKVWWNLNGFGTIAERDSLNVSSFDDNGTGNYDANITSDMNDTSYNLSGICSGHDSSGVGSHFWQLWTTDMTTSAVTRFTGYDGDGRNDIETITGQVLGALA